MELNGLQKLTFSKGIEMTIDWYLENESGGEIFFKIINFNKI